MNRGGVDLFGPISGELTPDRRRRILNDAHANKGDWRLSVVHVHPDDLHWVKSGRLLLKEGVIPRVDVQPLTREFAEIHNPLLPTPHCEEHYECTAAVSAPSSPFPGDSARRDSGGRSTTTDSSTAASRRVPGSRTPHTAIRVRKHRRMRGKRTPVREQAARVLSYDEDSGASDTQEHRINKEELVKAAARQKRITADSIERLSVELRRFQVEVKRLQSRERDLVASVKNVTAKLDALHERYLSYERLITDETLGAQCHMLTGWKSARTFKALWEYINGGENDWTSRCNHFRGGLDSSRERGIRPSARSLSMADAFFMHQFIMKQDVDFACAAYFFGVSPASASRYMITISAILDEFLTRKFPRMKASEIYATQPPSFKDVFGMPVHSIIDGTEIPMESSSNEYTRASTYSQYKGQTTVKFNVGLAANGLLDYISEGISGSTSDKKMCTNHGHLEWMKTMENDVEASDRKPHNPIVLADKGFCNVEPEYNAVGVFLARPARKIPNKPFTDCDVVQSRLTSNLRVHVERANWCLKSMSYFRNQKKITHIDMLSREVRNMMRLRVNYGTSLVHAIDPFSSTNVT